MCLSKDCLDEKKICLLFNHIKKTLYIKEVIKNLPVIVTNNI